MWQLESGYTFIRNDDGGVRTETHSVGELLFRYGVVDDWLELRINLIPISERSSSAGVTASQSGTEDLSLGCKLWLTAQDGVRPEVAVITALSVPTGTRAFSAREVQPAVNWLYGWDLSERVSTAGSTGFFRATDDLDHDYLEVTQSWTVGVQLADKLGSYLEWFAFLPHSSLAAQPEHYIDGGLTYQFTKDVQLDVRAGYGLNAAADDLFAGIGLTIRRP